MRELLSMPKAARRLGVTGERIHELVQSGELRTLAIDGKHFITLTELERYYVVRSQKGRM
jgi:hypothetical protein